MRILHVLKNTNDDICKPYIEFINKNFNPQTHRFMVEIYMGGANNYCADNVERIQKKKYLELIKELGVSDKIIIHGLSSPRLVLILFFQPWLLKKCYWVMWGGDLYYYRDREKNFRTNMHEFLRRPIIRKMGNIVALTRGDYQLVKDWYDTKAKYYQGLYISNIDLDSIEGLGIPESHGKRNINIQIGNSATVENNHFEVLEELVKFKDQDIKIYVPLSYGDMDYAKEVIEYGHSLFEEKFSGVLGHLDYEKYVRFLNTMDVAIFAPERQQALGNIYVLAYLGKKIYIRNDISTWEHLETDLGVKIFNYSDIKEIEFGDFTYFSEKDKSNNKKNIKRTNDVNEAKKIWEKIFNE